MYNMMSGVKMSEIHAAMLDAFTKDTLDEMLRFRLDKVLLNIVPDGALRNIVFNLLKLADREGWDAELVREAHRYIPGKVRLAEVYEKYGLAPRIALQREGVEQKAFSGGLEKNIRANNPALDMALWRTRLAEVEVRTCRIDIDDRDRTTGTGFLVGPEAVLTNYHVVESIVKGPRTASAISCLFDYKKLADGTENPGTRVPLHSAGGIVAYSPYTAGEREGRPDATVPTENELDFALLRLARPMGSVPISGPESPPRGYEVLPSTASTLVADQGIIIAHHPEGMPMKLAIDSKSVLVVNANGTRVRYTTNTDSGSSGSPVFNMLWDLVALHHYGDPARKNQPPHYNQGIAALHLIRSMISANGGEQLLGGNSMAGKGN